MATLKAEQPTCNPFLLNESSFNCGFIKQKQQFFIILILGELLFLNEATFLENLKTRYFKDKIYVSVRKN